MKIATWNVNSVRKRTENLVSWLDRAKPDVVVLQELKAQEPQFPKLEIEAAGYKVEMVGQKGFNGVALLSLHPVEITARTLPDAVADEPARYIEGKVSTPKGPLTVGGLYLPTAIRSAPRSSPTRSRGWTAWHSARRPFWRRKRCSSWVATTMSSRPTSTCSAPPPSPTMRSASLSRVRLFARFSTSA